MYETFVKHKQIPLGRGYYLLQLPRPGRDRLAKVQSLVNLADPDGRGHYLIVVATLRTRPFAVDIGVSRSL